MSATENSAASLKLAQIAAALEAHGGWARRFDVEVLAECDSSNSQLLARAEAGAPAGTVIVAERQTAGRGRRGRGWQSAAGDSLTFSLLWRFPAGTPLDGLSLAIGVALACALESLGVQSEQNIRLKWPNDVLLQGRKLAGILIELVSGAHAGEGTAVVIGIGLNLRLPQDLPDEIRRGAAALAETEAVLPAVHELLARLLIALGKQLEQFAVTGFAAVHAAWQQRHAFADCPVRLLDEVSPPRTGICRGVDAQGALLLETTAGLQHVVSGEVSLRLQD
jgi:BirA family biotin operon repressor/biotin-[acetyl-CoA-carboxylase] ligase